MKYKNENLHFLQLAAMKNDGDVCDSDKLYECRSHCCAATKDPVTNKWILDADGEIETTCQPISTDPNNICNLINSERKQMVWVVSLFVLSCVFALLCVRVYM